MSQDFATIFGFKDSCKVMPQPRLLIFILSDSRGWAEHVSNFCVCVVLIDVELCRFESILKTQMCLSPWHFEGEGGLKRVAYYEVRTGCINWRASQWENQFSLGQHSACIIEASHSTLSTEWRNARLYIALHANKVEICVWKLERWLNICKFPSKNYTKAHISRVLWTLESCGCNKRHSVMVCILK